MLGDTLPKSFLQLRGISVANFNMGCNFSVAVAIRMMIQCKLSILAIQEHTPWNRELSDMEITSIHHTCEKWGVLVTVMKLQILLIDKQLASNHQTTNIYEDGRLIRCRFEILQDKYVTFIPVYGVPHSTNNRIHQDQQDIDESTTIKKMKDT